MVPSLLTRDHGRDPSECFNTSCIFKLLLVAIKTMQPNSLWSAFKTASLLFVLDFACFLDYWMIWDTFLEYCYEILYCPLLAIFPSGSHGRHIYLCHKLLTSLGAQQVVHHCLLIDWQFQKGCCWKVLSTSPLECHILIVRHFHQCADSKSGWLNSASQSFPPVVSGRCYSILLWDSTC